MLILRLRFIVLLSLVYLSLVLMLYSYLWKSHSLEHGLGLLETHPHPSPHHRDPDSDTVLFNFKRRNGFFEDTNASTNASNLSNASPKPLPQNSSRPTAPRGMNSRTSTNQTLSSLSALPPPSRCVHTFYYMWYGNPKLDKKYYHWNHRYLPHWQESITKRYPQGRHQPPDDIGAGYYPELGCYSSRDPLVLEAHMRQMRKAGVGVASVSWYPGGKADEEGFPPDPLVPLLLDAAQRYDVKVTFHIEPYQGRSPTSVRRDIQYIIETYSPHPAFYWHPHRGGGGGGRGGTTTSNSSRGVPLIYVYDSYLSSAKEWAELLKPGSPSSIRGTRLDSVVLGLLVERAHQQSILAAGFDGFYTYFASDGFSYGSRTANWKTLADFARRNGLAFVPSFGPGYDDTKVRPWNGANTKSRMGGDYYRKMSRAASGARVGPHGGRGGDGIISVTSFNEWHEGTQIESAVPKVSTGLKYLDYAPHRPDFYLELTREVAHDLQCTL